MAEAARSLNPRDKNTMSVSLREVQARVAYYVRAVALNQQSLTIIDRDRPVAVLTPADISASLGSNQRLEEVSAGWAHRLATVRDDLQRRHAADVTSLRRELRQAWELLDELAPRGTNGQVDRLRASQRDLLND